MDDIIFYNPVASSDQPRLPSAGTPSITPGASFKPLTVRQTASHLHHSKLDQHHRDNTIQEQENLRVIANFPSSDDDDFPDLDTLLSGMTQKHDSASAVPNSDGNNNDDNDDFPDIDEFLPGTKQRSVSTSAKPSYGNTAGQVEDGGRGDSPSSDRSRKGSTQDPIILSDDESAGAESETDYSDLDVDLRAKRCFDPSHAADSELADNNGFTSEITSTPERIVADHRNDDSENNLVDNTVPRLSLDSPRSSSSSYGFVKYKATKQRANTGIAQGSTSFDDRHITMELEKEDFTVFAEGKGEGIGEDNDSTRSTKGVELPAVPDNNPASDSKIPDLQAGQPNYTRSPQLVSVAASPNQSDSTSDHLPKHDRGHGATRNIRRKRPQLTTPTRQAGSTSTASAALAAAHHEQSQSYAVITAPDQEWEIHGMDEEMADNGSTDDSDDEDYDAGSDAGSPKEEGRPRCRKRVRRTKDTEYKDLVAPSTPSSNVSYLATAVTSSVSTQESEQISIRGYLTLKTIESKVVYCLTFSQELLPEPRGTSQRQAMARSLSGSSDKRSLERSPAQERDMSGPVRNPRFSSEDDELLRQLKREGLSWDEISEHFPERSKGTLQVHYSTKLKPRSETSKHTKKRPRCG